MKREARAKCEAPGEAGVAVAGAVNEGSELAGGVGGAGGSPVLLGRAGRGKQSAFVLGPGAFTSLGMPRKQSASCPSLEPFSGLCLR